MGGVLSYDRSPPFPTIPRARSWYLPDDCAPDGLTGALYGPRHRGGVGRPRGRGERSIRGRLRREQSARPADAGSVSDTLTVAR